jgi:NADH-quinone oxidoreductase subunit M
MGGVGLVFALASLGLPGLGNFVGEFLVLLGTFRVNGLMAVLASGGFIVAAVYSLWIVQRVFHGQRDEALNVADLSGREMSVMTVMIVVILWLGLYPQPVFDAADPALRGLQRSVAQGSAEDVWQRRNEGTGSR